MPDPTLWCGSTNLKGNNDEDRKGAMHAMVVQLVPAPRLAADRAEDHQLCLCGPPNMGSCGADRSLKGLLAALVVWYFLSIA
jgi:hypothetical protein